MTEFQKDDVIYVEPNEIAEYVAKKEGKIPNTDGLNNNIAWNQEELQYSIDLQVIIPNRSDCGQIDYDLKQKLVSTNVTNSNSQPIGRYVSFLGGEDLNGEKYLTTNYTNISYQEITGNGVSGKDTLGIKDIDINFDAHFFPVVKINFTDVRGSALFSPAENESQWNRVRRMSTDERTSEETLSNADASKYLNTSTEEVSKSFFKALFHFPYPKFLLSVKGYYGDRVTFILSVSDFKTSFNPSNGNFDVTVSFIGYMYGLYTDIPMNLIIVSPYYNSEYWNANRVEGGSFRFIENDGTEGSEIITYIDYLKKYDSLLNGDGSNNSEINKNLAEYSSLCTKKTRLSNLQGLRKNILTSLFGYDKNYTIKGDKNNAYFFEKTDGVSLDCELFNKYRNAYNDYEKIYGTLEQQDVLITNYTSNYIVNYSASTNGICSTVINEDKTTTKANDSEIDNLCSALFNNENTITYPTTIEKDKSRLKEYITNNTSLYTNHCHWVCLNESQFIKFLETKISELDTEIREGKEKANENIQAYLQESFGFTLSIENIYRMIFAHLDTFIDWFNKMLTNISNENTSGKRSPSYLGLDMKNSDINLTQQDLNKTYPFFAYKQDGKLEYPGIDSANENLKNCEEVKRINELYDYVLQYGKDVSEELNNIEANSTILDDFCLPSTLSDIVRNTGNTNHYSNVRDNANDIMYLLYARIVLIMSLLPSSARKDSLIKIIIDNEVKNLYKAKQNLNSTLLNDLNNYNYDKLYDVYKGIGNNVPYPVYKNCNGLKCDLSQKSDEYYGVEYFTTSALTEITRYANIRYLKDEYYNIIDGSSFNSNTLKRFIDLYSDSYKMLASNSKFYDRTKNFDMKVYENTENDVKEYKYSEPKSIESYQNDLGDIIGVDTSNLFIDYLGGYVHELSENQRSEYKGKPRKIFENILAVENVDSDDTGLTKTLIEKQGNNHARALVLLASMSNLYCDYDEYMEKLFSRNDSQIIMAPLPLLLYIGGLLFYRQNTDSGYKIENVFTTDEDFKKYFADKNSGITLTAGSILRRDSTLKKDGVLFGRGDVVSDEYLEKISGNTELTQVLISMFENFANLECKTIIEMEKTYTIGDNHVVRFTSDSKIGKYLANFYCKTVCLINRKNYLYNEQNNDTTISSIQDTLFPYIVEKVKSTYSGEIESYKNTEENDVDTSKQSLSIKFAMYYTLKTLYDKWLCTYSKDKFKLKPVLQDKASTKSRFYEGNQNTTENNTEYNSFLFVDSLMNDISSDYLVNPDTIYNLIKKYTVGIDNQMGSNNSVFEFMNEIAQKSKLLFVSLPVFSNYYSMDAMKNIFTPNFQYGSSHPTYDRGYGNTYMLVYTGEPSKYLNDNSEYQDDAVVLDILGTDVDIKPATIDSTKTEERTKMVIPAFGVTYAKQNQMYFKNVNVNMDNPKVTDYSIANLLHLSQEGAHGADIQSIGIGQDIYSIYSNRSYTCTVEMLGCVNIMPMMYFSLNSIPMFRGLYMIINVSHNIVPGNMTTKFTGVRLSKNDIGHIDYSFDYESIFNRIDKSKRQTVIKTNQKQINGLGQDGGTFDRCYPEGWDGFPTVDTAGNKREMETMITGVTINVHKTQDRDETITVQINKGIARAFKAAFEEIYNSTGMTDGSKICIKTVGGYSWRPVKDTSGNSTGKMSNHSYGIAFDINASNTNWLEGTNGYMSKGTYDKDDKHAEYKKDTPTQFRNWKHPAVQILIKHGFGWGIYSDRYDWMHFSAAVSNPGSNHPIGC